MHKNKYQRRRGMRPSTSAASATQQELIQGPIQQPSPSQISNDLGRETARQLRENANPNTTFIDKPTPTSDRNLLRQASERQKSMIRDAQQQAFSKGNAAQSKPKASPSNLVFKGGAVHYQPAMRTNLLTAVAGIAADALVEPLADVISDNVIHPLIGAAFGKDIPKVEELRRREAMRIKDNAEVVANDAYNETMRQRRLEEAAMPIGVDEALGIPSFLCRLQTRLQRLLSRCLGIFQEHIHNHQELILETVNTRFVVLLLETTQPKKKWMRLLLMD